MEPGFACAVTDRGLIDMSHRGLPERDTDTGHERGQRLGGLGEPVVQRPDRESPFSNFSSTVILPNNTPTKVSSSPNRSACRRFWAVRSAFWASNQAIRSTASRPTVYQTTRAQ